MQKVGINLYTDTFQLLVKYDDHYDLEDVCADIYSKCVKSIVEKCAEDPSDLSVGVAEFIDYLEEIIGDDLELKNIVTTKLIKEFIRLNKETETTDDIAIMREQLVQMEAREKEKLKELVSTQRRDEKRIDSLKSSVTDLNKRMCLREKQIVKCSNCRSVDCKRGIHVKNLFSGMKVRSDGIGHTCSKHLGDAQVYLPKGTEGILKSDFTIEWSYNGEKINCKCSSKISGWDNVVYNC